VPIQKIKPFFPDKPIIFNRIGTKGKSTYWFVFMKIPSSEQIIAPVMRPYSKEFKKTLESKKKCGTEWIEPVKDPPK